MANIVRGRTDPAVRAVKQALDEYETQHAGSEAALYRGGAASIRVRVVDRRFEGMSKARRHDNVWRFLAERVTDDNLSEVSMVLPLPPSELGSNLANLDFEDPLPTRL